MPYSNPNSPSAVETASSSSAPFSFSTRAIHRSHHLSPQHAHHMNLSASPSGSPASPPTWSTPASGPMPVVPRRASSSSRAPSSSPSQAPAMVFPRRGSRDKSPTVTPPRRGTPAEAESSLGLSVGDSPATNTVSLDETTPPPTPAEPTTPIASTSASSSPPVTASPAGHASASVPFPSSPSPPLPSPPVRRESVSSRAALQRAGSPSLRVDIPSVKPHPQHSLHHHGRHHSHIGASSTSAPVRPSPMIRKKSGELVRPALKSRTSYSTPNSAGVPDEEETSDDRWNQCRSAPATPGIDGSERKTLRFADGDGEEGELERVVLFKREHKVTAVTRVLEGEDLERVTDTETEGEGAGRNTFGSVWASPKYYRSSSASGSSSANSDKDKVEIHRSESTAVPRIPALNLGDNNRGRPLLVPEYDQVVLETMELVDEGGPSGALTLKGTVVVRNITFGKWVAIRFTFDEWQTVSEVSAVHAVHIPSSQLGPSNAAGQGWDRFTFSVKLDDVRRKITERHLLLAVKYSIEGGAEWWDSNDGANYKVRFKKIKVPVAPPQPTRSKSDTGGAFLPFLEAKKHVTPSTMYRHHSTTGGNSPPKSNTHLALPNRLPSAFQTGESHSRSSPWTFPHHPADPDAPTKSSPPPVHSILKNDHAPVMVKPGASVASSPGSSPLKLKNYCPPTSPPTSPPKDLAADSSRFGKFATVSGGSGSGTSSPVRPGHTRSRSSVSIGGGSRDFGTFPPPAYMRPTQSSFPPVTPSSISTTTKVPSVISTAPLSPPMSANHSPPSPTESLLATPLPNHSVVSPSVLVSPGVMTFDLPDLGVEASGNPAKRVSPVQKEVNLPSTSYNDFIQKYCFFQGAPSVSPPLSESPSPSSSTTYLPFSGKAHLSVASPNRSPLSSGQTTPLGSGNNSPHGFGHTTSFLPPAWNVASPSLSTHSGSDGALTPTGIRMPAGGVFWGTESTGSGSPPRRSPPAAGGAGRVIPAMRG